MGKTNRNKKEKERKLVTALLNKLRLIGFQLLPIKEAEGDFLLAHDGRRIAIEATELMYVTPEGFSRMQFKKICEIIVERAEELFRQYDTKEELEVRVSFTDNSGKINYDKNNLLKGSDIFPLAAWIVKLAVQYLPSPGRTVLLDHYRGLQLSRLLTDKIQNITIDNVTGKWEGFFSTSGGYAVPKITPELCQEKIDEKNHKPIKYGRNFDAYWLLIAVDTFSFAGHWDLDFVDKIISYSFNSNYDKTYLFDSGTNDIFELDVQTAI